MGRDAAGEDAGRMSQPACTLLDVEGTVAPISLTTEMLFPHARKHFEEFLWGAVSEIEDRKPGDSPEGTVLMDLLLLSMENRAEIDPGAPRILPEYAIQREFQGEPRSVSMSPAKGIPRILAYVYWLMDRDRKSTALKIMQGKIWKAGYERRRVERQRPI